MTEGGNRLRFLPIVIGVVELASKFLCFEYGEHGLVETELTTLGTLPTYLFEPEYLACVHMYLLYIYMCTYK